MATTKKGSGAAAGDTVHLEGIDYTIRKELSPKGHFVLLGPKDPKTGKGREVTVAVGSLALLEDADEAIFDETVGWLKRQNSEDSVKKSIRSARKNLAGRKKAVFYLPGRLMPPANAET